LRRKRGDVTAHEHLTAADANDQRSVHTRTHDAIGLVRRDDHQRARSLHAVERAANRAGEITVEGVLDEMGDDLGVGLAEELVSARHQLCA
jgi:hypothetical protein